MGGNYLSMPFIEPAEKNSFSLLLPVKKSIPCLRPMRRERDSNPRYQFCQYNILAGCRFRPLSHLSSGV